MAYRKLNDGTYVDDDGNVINEQEYQQLGFGPNGIPNTDRYNENVGPGYNPEDVDTTFELGTDIAGLVDNGAPVTGADPEPEPVAAPTSAAFGTPPPSGDVNAFNTMSEGFNALVADANTPGMRTGKEPNTEMDSKGVTASASETATDSGGITVTDEDIKTIGEEESEVNKTGAQTTEGETREESSVNKGTEFSTDTNANTAESTLNEANTESATQANVESETQGWTESANQGWTEFDRALQSQFENEEMFQNWSNSTAQGWTDEQKQTWLDNQQQGWSDEERRSFEQQVNQTNSERETNVEGAREGTVRTDVDDEYGFGSFLRNLAERDSDELGRKNDRLSALSSGGNIKSQVAAAVRQAISGPAAQGAGSSAQARVGSRAAAEVGANIFGDRVNAASAMESGGNLGVGAANAARQFSGSTQQSAEDYTEDTSDAQTVAETSDRTGVETSSGIETTVGRESGKELGRGSNVDVVSESGTQMGSSSGTEASNETGVESNTTLGTESNTTLGTESSTTLGTETSIATGLRDVSTNQSVTGFEEVDQTINSIASSFSETLTDEQINSMASTIQEMTKDATNATEAWERLSGVSLGSMFGETFGVQPESGGGGKVLCTMYHEHDYITRDIYMDDLTYAKRFDMNVIIGYHWWAIPLVNWLRRRHHLNPVFQFVRLLTVAWANEMSHRMCGHGRASLIGKLLIAAGVPACRSLGRYVVLNNLTSQKGAI